MGKVIAFDKNRLRSKPHATACTQSLQSQMGLRSNSRIHHFPQKKEIIEVSVVVLAGGHPHLLSHCLASLLFQQFEASRYEIIVVEDRPNRATRDIVNDWAKHASRSGPALAYIGGHGNEGMAAARNRGWMAARGAIVAFTDEDTVARPDWLQKGSQALDNEAAQAVWGRVVSPNMLAATSLHPGDTATEKMQPGATSNYFVRKTVLNEVGGFDERFKFAWGEEADLYFRLSSQRMRVVHYSQAIVTRPSQTAGFSHSLVAQRNHQAEVLLSKKHPQLYRQKMQQTPYAQAHLVTLALMLTLAFAAAGASLLAIACAALWIAFTLHLWSRRQWNAAERTLPRLFISVCIALLTPPLTAFWHAIAWLRFRRITA